MGFVNLGPRSQAVFRGRFAAEEELSRQWSYLTSWVGLVMATRLVEAASGGFLGEADQA